MNIRLSLGVALLSALAPLCAQVAVPDEHGFDLIVPATMTLPAGDRQSFVVSLAIPEGFYVSRDVDLKVPEIEVTGLGSGVEVELGPEPEPEDKPAGEVYVGRYSRTVTLRAGAQTILGSRRPEVSLRFVSCDAGLCYPPRKLSHSFGLEVIQDGAGSVTYAPAKASPEPEDRSLYYGIVAVALGFVVLRVLRSRR